MVHYYNKQYYTLYWQLRRLLLTFCLWLTLHNQHIEGVPTVTSLSPIYGPVHGGTPVTITGSDFNSIVSTDLLCYYGTLISTATRVTDTSVTCASPSSEGNPSLTWPSYIGAVTVTLASDNGVTVVGGTTLTYTYYANATVTTVFPLFGAIAGGYTLTITGSQFTINVGDLYCKFGSLPPVAADTVTATSTHIECPVPSTSSIGTIGVEITSNQADYTTDNIQFTYLDVATVTSIYPEFGGITGGTIITVTGTNFVDTPYLACQFGAMTPDTTTVIWLSATTLTCVAPASAAGFVTVEISNNNQDFTGNGNQYEYVAEITVTNRAPTTAATAGGLSITVTGTNFLSTGYLRCRWSDPYGTDPDDVIATWNSVTEILCPVPTLYDWQVGVFTLEFTNNGLDYTNLGTTVTIELLPVIISFTPLSGPIGGATVVTITGTGFSLAGGACQWSQDDTPGLVYPATTYVSLFPAGTDSTQIVCSSMAHAAGLVALEVSISSYVQFTTQRQMFLYYATPSVTSITPTLGSESGRTLVTLTGTGFIDTGELRCKFGSDEVYGEYINDVTMVCVAPVVTTGTGAVSVEMSNNAQDYTADAIQWTYISPVQITGIVPTTIPISTATIITINGGTFVSVPTLQCRFRSTIHGEHIIAATYVSSSQITCVIPTGFTIDPLCYIEVTVNGLDYTADSFSITYYIPPEVTSISPTTGPITGGTIVTVTGTDFLGDAICVMDGNAVTPDSYSSTSLLCRAPSTGTEAIIEIYVYDTMLAWRGVAHHFSYTALPTVTSVIPTWIALPVDTSTASSTLLTVRGTNFLDTSLLMIRIGSYIQTATWLSPTVATCSLPVIASPQVLTLSITNNNDDYSTGTTVTVEFTNAWAMTSLEPVRASLVGNTKITIHGSNFVSTLTSWCSWGGTVITSTLATPAEWISASEMICWTPAYVSATTGVNLWLTLDGGITWSDSSLPFEFYNPPQVSSITPIHGPASGYTRVTVTGARFINGDSKCTFGGVDAISTDVITSTTIECVSPVAVSSPSAAPLLVVDSLGATYNHLGVQYWYDLTETVTAIYPTNMSSIGLAISPYYITIMGTNFLQPSSSEISCKFGALPSALVDYWDSPTQVRCRLPVALSTSTLGPVIVEMANNGVDFTSSAHYFTIISPPVLSSISPLRVPVRGAQVITIVGSGFVATATLLCRFDGSNHVAATFISATQITCIAPPVSTPGDVTIDVTTNGIEYTVDQGTVTYYVLSTTLTVKPAHGPAAGGTWITLTGTDFIAGDAYCLFGGTTSVTATVISATYAICQAPSFTVGATTVHITDALSESFDYSPLIYTYDSDATVVSVTPLITYVSSGTAITVTGTNFLHGDDLRCRVGSTIMSMSTTPGVIWLSSTTIICGAIAITPVTATTVYEVSVSNNALDYTSPGIDFKYGVTPVASSIAPDNGRLLGGTPLTVTGTGFVSTSTLYASFGGTVVSLIYVSATSMTCIIPTATVTGSVVFQFTMNNHDWHNDGLTYTYTPVVHVTSAMTLASTTFGTTTGGTLVTLVGDNFDTSATYYRFGSSGTVILAMNVVTPVSTSIIVASPAGIAGTTAAIEISVNLVDWSSSQVDWLWVAPVILSSIAPISGVYLGSDTVIVFASTSCFINTPSLSCRFGGPTGTIVSATWRSATSVSCVTPAASAGDIVTVDVTNNGVDWNEGSTSITFTYFELATVTDITPLYVSQEFATTVTIHGSGFLAQVINQCTFGSVTIVAATVITDTSLTCSFPAEMPAGTYTVSVNSGIATGNNGVVSSFNLATHVILSSITLLVEASPRVISLTPNNGPASGGTATTITGRHFIDGRMICLFGTSSLLFSSVSAVFIDTQTVMCIVPASYTGVALNAIVHVVTDSAVWPTGTLLDERHFHYYNTPSALSVSPTAIPSATAIAVTIYGTNFFPVITSSLLSCSFTDTLTTVVTATWLAPTAVLCTAPASAIGVLQLRVTNNGVDYTSDLLYVTVVAIPTLVSVTPTFGSLMGGTIVTLTGTDFIDSPSLSCTFIDPTTTLTVKEPATYVTSSSITCITPQFGTGTGSVTVTNDRYVSAATSLAWVWVPEPLLFSVTPTRGPVSGGTIVTLTGSGFLTMTTDVSPMACIWNGVTASDTPVIISNTKMMCIAPAMSTIGVVANYNTSATVSLRVSINGYDRSDARLRYTYQADAIVTSLIPSILPSATPSQIISVHGDNFVRTTDLACRFNGITVVTATWINPTQVNCLAPIYAPAAIIPIEVTNNGIDYTNNGITITYVVAPSLNGLSLPRVPLSAQFVITVTGVNLYNSANVWCQFGILATTPIVAGSSRVLQSPATWIDASSVTCVTPAVNTPQYANVTLAFGDLSFITYSSNALQLEYYTQPRVLSLSPTAGSVDGGTLVIVTGTRFAAGDVICSFGGIRSTVTRWISTTQLRCLAPVSAVGVGLVSVTILDSDGYDSGALPATYSYITTAVVTRISPVRSTIPSGALITVFGSGYVNSAALACRFSTLIVPATWLSTTSLQCIAPVRTSITNTTYLSLIVNVEVTNNGFDFTNNVQTFTYLVRPTFTVSYPPIGPLGGVTTITINGTSFLTDSIAPVCRFGGSDLMITLANVTSTNMLVCSSPAGNGVYFIASIDISFENNEWIPTNLTFEYTSPMHVSYILPLYGPITGGTYVNVYGDGFIDGVMYCSFGLSRVEAIYINSTALVCISPVGPITSDLPDPTAPQAVALEVVTSTGVFYSQSHIDYTYQAATTLLSITPQAGIADGGDTVLITGSVGSFSRTPLLSCQWGTPTTTRFIITPATWRSSSQLTCISPAIPRVPARVQVSVTNNGYDYSDTSVTFVYRERMDLGYISNNYGSIAGGLTLTLFGENFRSPATDIDGESFYCQFISNRYNLATAGWLSAVVPMTWISRTQVTCVTPSVTAAGTVDIRVVDHLMRVLTAPYGLNTTNFTYAVPPKVTSLSPATGPLSGGTLITVTGTGFDTSLLNVRNGNQLVCSFGGTTSVVATYISDTQITCTAPSSIYTEISSSITVDNDQGRRIQVTVEVGLPDLLSASGATWTYTSLQVTSLSPAMGSTQGGTVVAVMGRYFINSPSLQCLFGNVTASQIVFVSSTRILCRAPQAAVNTSAQGTWDAYLWTVAVEVSNNGIQYSTSNMLYTYYLPMVITSFSPMSVPSMGSPITIFGTGFVNTSLLQCRFGTAGPTMNTGGIMMPTQLQNINSTTAVICQAPWRTSALTNVNISLTYNGIEYVYASQPLVYNTNIHVRQVIPAVGIWSGGTSVDIWGTSFINAPGQMYCMFTPVDNLAIASFYQPPAGFYSPITYISSTHVSCVSPVTDLNTDDEEYFYHVEVTFNRNGNFSGNYTTNRVLYLYSYALQLSSIAPTHAPYTGGTNLLLYGGTFSDMTSLTTSIWCRYSNTSGWYNDQLATRISDTIIQCTTPSYQSIGGNVTIQVTNNLVDWSNALVWTYNSRMTVTSVTPSYEYLIGGATIIVNGTGFQPSDSDLMCRFNQTIVAATYISDTQVSCVAPPMMQPGDYIVEVTTNGIDFTANYRRITYIMTPTIYAIDPLDGPTTGGTIITIFGRNFTAGSAAYPLKCRFGDISVTATYLTSDWITCVAPANYTLADYITGVALVSLEVTNNDQTYTNWGVPYLYTNPIVFDDIMPSGARISGGTRVRLFGDKFRNVTTYACRFANVTTSIDVPAIYVSSTEVGCWTPSWSLPQQVTVKLSYNGRDFVDSTQGPLPFSFEADVRVMDINPKVGPSYGLTLVTITGQHFLNTSDLRCAFGYQQSRYVIYISSTTLICPSPGAQDSSSMIVNVSVSNNLLDFSDVPAPQFTYVFAPTITDVVPVRGPQTGATLVMINGTNMMNMTGSSPPFMTCRFNDTIVNATYISTTQVSCVSPAMAQTGSVTLEVAVNGIDYTDSGAQYIYDPPIGADFVLPSSGPRNGSTLVAVFGSNFFDTPLLSARFGDAGDIYSVVVACSYMNASLIQCATPVFNPIGYPGLASRRLLGIDDEGFVQIPIWVSNNGYNYESTGQYFTYYPAIGLNGVYPAWSFTAGGTAIFVHGSNYQNNSYLSCLFDTLMVPATYISPVLIMCTSPAHAPNASIMVTASNNQQDWATPLLNFTYIECPPGYFIDGSALRPCPSGAYCSGSWSNGNYTLCATGTYMPWSGATTCMTCPRGYYCPLQGMMKPFICAAGYTCPTTGLVTNGPLCPEGTYCGTGMMTMVNVVANIARAPQYFATVIDGFDTTLEKIVSEVFHYTNGTVWLGEQQIVVANDTNGGTELYINTTSGLQLLGGSEVNPLTTIPLESGKSAPELWTVHDDQIYWTAWDGVSSGRTLFSYSSITETRASRGIYACSVAIGNELPANRPYFMGVMDNIMWFGVSTTPSLRSIDIDSLFSGDASYGSGGSSPIFLTISQGYMYYSAIVSGTNRQLYRVDSATRTPVMLSLSAAPTGANPVYVGSLHQTYLYFATDNPVSGDQRTIVWKVDGSQTATFDATFIVDTSNNGNDTYWLEYVTEVYFAMNQSAIGVESTIAGQEGLFGRLYLSALPLGISSSMNDSYRYASLWEIDASTNEALHISIDQRPMPCNASLYCIAGTRYNDSYAIDAPATTGSYMMNTIPKAAFVPRQCHDGYLCHMGAATPRGDGPCPIGYYCLNGTAIPCPTTMFCPTIGMTVPKLCPPGTFNPIERQSECRPCPHAYICPTYGMDTPIICPAGYVCNTTGLIQPATACPACYYCSEGTSTMIPNNTLEWYPLESQRVLYQADPTGVIFNVPHGPYDCPPTAFCVGGVGYNDTIEGNPLHPQPCTPGYYCYGAACSPLGNAICPAGHYCPKSSAQPIVTPLGTYAYYNGSALPSPCLPGYYSNATGLIQCEDCPAGFSCTSDSTIIPTACVEGYWRGSDPSVIFCQACPEGTWSDATELPSVDLCTLCDAGWICGNEAATTPPQLDDKNLCREGFVCDIGTTSVTAKTSLCPAGYYCDYGTTPATARNLSCDAGYYCPAGSKMSDYKENQCTAGYYCPLGMTDSPATFGDTYKCPQATTSAVGATNILDCKQTCILDPSIACSTVASGSMLASGTTYIVVPSMSLVEVTINLEKMRGASNDSTVNARATQMQYNEHYTFAISYLWYDSPNTYAVTVDLPSYLRSDTDSGFKYAPIVRFNIYGIAQEPTDRPDGTTRVAVDVHILHGLFTDLITSFVGIATYKIRSPARAALGDATYIRPQFYALIRKTDQITTLDMDLPANLPQDGDNRVMLQWVGTSIITNTTQIPTSVAVEITDPNTAYYPNGTTSTLVEFEDPTVTFADILNTTTGVTDAFWRLSEAGTNGGESYLVFPYFPFFSACEGYDSQIPIFHPFERDDHGFCNLPTPAETTYVGDFDFLKPDPISDRCETVLQCTYEEELKQLVRKRWFELEQGSTIFYMTQSPISASDYTKSGSNAWQKFGSMVGSDQLVPVTVNADRVGILDWKFPRTVVLNIGYFQVDSVFKKLVDLNLTLANFEVYDDTNSTNNQYSLTLIWRPLSWSDLMNKFQLGLLLYAVLFVLIGLAASSLVAFFFVSLWVYVRCAKRQRSSPAFHFRFWGFAKIIVPAPAWGTFVAGVPVMLGGLTIYLVFLNLYPFADFPGSYSESSSVKLSLEEQQGYQYGRIGTAYVTMALFILITGAQMFVPERPLLGVQTDMWLPVHWKRWHMIFVAVLLGLAVIWLIELSYSEWYGENVYICIIAMKLAQIVIDHALNSLIGEYLLLCPMMTGVALMQFLVTMGAASFQAFLISYFMQLCLTITERVFLYPAFKRMWETSPLFFMRLKRRLLLVRSKKEEADRLRRKINHFQDEYKAQTIEPMLQSYANYANETMSLFLSPILLAFVIAYSLPTRIPANYLIRDTDLTFYLFFSVITIAPQMIMDIFVLNTQEAYYAWPLFDYLEFAQFRFKTRTARWKANEPNVDETLDAVMQSIDQACFSSQFYFISGYMSFGIMLVFLGMTILLQQQFNMFADPLFPTILGFVIFTGLLITQVSQRVAEKRGLWSRAETESEARERLARRQRGRRGRTAATQAGGDKANMERKLAEMKNITAVNNALAIQQEEARGIPIQVLMTDVVRKRFLEKNSPWLLQKLTQVFTPRTLEKYKPYLMRHYRNLNKGKMDMFKGRKKRGKNGERGDISSDDEDSGMEELNRQNWAPPELDAAGESIVYFWLQRARRILELRHLVRGVIVKEMKPFCFQCNTTNNLQVEQLIGMEEMVARFDRERAEGFPTADPRFHQLRANEQWRGFFRAHQKFRTRCAQCIKKDEEYAAAAVVGKHEISDDERSDDAQDPNGGLGLPLLPPGVVPVVEIPEDSLPVIHMWLLLARGKLRKVAPMVPRLALDDIGGSGAAPATGRATLASLIGSVASGPTPLPGPGAGHRRPPSHLPPLAPPPRTRNGGRGRLDPVRKDISSDSADGSDDDSSNHDSSHDDSGTGSGTDSNRDSQTRTPATKGAPSQSAPAAAAPTSPPIVMNEEEKKRIVTPLTADDRAFIGNWLDHARQDIARIKQDRIDALRKKRDHRRHKAAQDGGDGDDSDDSDER